MDLKRKIEIVEKSIESIGAHTDEDAAVLHVALDRVQAFIEVERKGISDRVAAEIEEKLGG